MARSAAISKSKIENAKTIAIRAIVFVRNARKAGHVNVLNNSLLWDVADEFGMNEADFNIKTVRRFVREYIISGEEVWVKF